MYQNSGFQGFLAKVLGTVSALLAENQFLVSRKSKLLMVWAKNYVVFVYRFLITKQEIDVYVLKYRWYAQARYYRAHAHPLGFLEQLKK